MNKGRQKDWITTADYEKEALPKINIGLKYSAYLV